MFGCPRAPQQQEEAAEAEGGEPQATNSLATMFKPPTQLLFRGTFDEAKEKASAEGKWLLLNVQSMTEFASHMLNRDTFGHELVKDTIRTNFVFHQILDTTHDGMMATSYYKLTSFPVILVIDPITGAKVNALQGFLTAEKLLEELVNFMGVSPLSGMPAPKRTKELPAPQSSAPGPMNEEEQRELEMALQASLEDNPGAAIEIGDGKSLLAHGPESTSQKEAGAAVKRPEDLMRAAQMDLGEEPAQGAEGSCRIGLRLPNGERVMRRMMKTAPVQTLFTLCRASALDMATGKPFRMSEAIPGSEVISEDTEGTIESLGIANAMLQVSWIE
eukprot:scaffold990_cov393-Prasinococcus_capsulatus_cf.AAC.9